MTETVLIDVETLLAEEIAQREALDPHFYRGCQRPLVERALRAGLSMAEIERLLAL